VSTPKYTPLVYSPNRSFSKDIIKLAASNLREGFLVGFPTETVYGLGVDATNKDAVAHLYQVKGRPSYHPLIVHISSLVNLDMWARNIPEYATKLARAFWPGPMTLILPRTNLAMEFITGNQDSVGIRVPSHPLASALLKEFEGQGGLGVAAPSANRFGKVSPTTADAVFEGLYGYLSPADLILDGGPCQIGVESTIINCTQDIPEILRPGAITATMISDLVRLQVNQIAPSNNKLTIKAPGLLQSHYAPKAKVFLSTKPNLGDGFIALSDISTPAGAIRLASPKDNNEYGKLLYQALRLADTKQLSRIIVIPPTGDDLAIAICDRLEKCAYKN
jgi:L-threonylcarbamoyladenylate synthase